MRDFLPVSDGIVLDPDLDLSPLADTHLFYPCSGGDLWTPMVMFAPFVKGFCFADYGYFRPNHQNTRHYGLDVAVEEAGPIPAPNGEWELISRDIIPSGKGIWGEKLYSLKEHYRLIATGKMFEVIRAGIDARDAFARFAEPLGVFFYRGDSLGEGGSGIPWNSADMHDLISQRLIHEGLFITDGCNPGQPPAEYPGNSAVITAREMKPGDFWRWGAYLKDNLGDGGDISCVGFAGYHYGGTLVWRYCKAAAAKNRG